MCQIFSKEEIKECCTNPNFCVVCLSDRSEVSVKNHVCEECQKGRDELPRRLPTVTLDNGKTYFIDVRLKQLRNVDNPHDSIDFFRWKNGGGEHAHR